MVMFIYIKICSKFTNDLKKKGLVWFEYILL